MNERMDKWIPEPAYLLITGQNQGKDFNLLGEGTGHLLVPLLGLLKEQREATYKQGFLQAGNPHKSTSCRQGKWADSC